MTLSLLFWLTLAAAGVSFWWQSDRVRSFAYEHVLKYSRERGLQLLDQSLVLVGLKPVRGDEGGATFKTPVPVRVLHDWRDALQRLDRNERR